MIQSETLELSGAPLTLNKPNNRHNQLSILFHDYCHHSPSDAFRPSLDISKCLLSALPTFILSLSHSKVRSVRSEYIYLSDLNRTLM